MYVYATASEFMTFIKKMSNYVRQKIKYHNNHKWYKVVVGKLVSNHMRRERPIYNLSIWVMWFD